MARPNKTGLDYFPLDVDFFNDEKISAISGEFGIKGELACIKLLCAIYRNGYFILWSEVLRMKLIKELPGVSADLLDNIVSRLVRWGLFDKALFDENGILTSSGIQRRYFEITRRRVSCGDKNLPWLLVSVCNNGVSVDRNCRSKGVSVDRNSQSKGKKRKVKKENRKETFDFGFVENGFEVFHEWIEYKKSRRESYKTQNSLEICYKNLKKLSGGAPGVARLIVEQSIGNNWAGLFELKDKSNGSKTVNSRIIIGDRDYGDSTV
jgi:hypothetical protein